MYWVCLFFSCALRAGSELLPPPFLPSMATEVNWVFSGLVTNELGEQFSYLFQMQRDGLRYHSVAALFDAETKALLFQDEGFGEMTPELPYRWSAGHSFLRFNPINASWILGVSTPDKQGFNFKIDMLNPEEKPLIQEQLRSGLSVVMSQTNLLNGHIRLGAERSEQFVTASHAWMREISVLTPLENSHSVNGLLCHFKDGSSLYSLNLHEDDTQSGAVAGWFDKMGTAKTISQFIDSHQLPEGAWEINVPLPRLHLLLAESIKHNTITAGFAEDKTENAFCLLSQDELGMHALAPVV
ncbi:MAG: hypothetical protein B7X00_00025 [Legionella sp. 21-45-4]|nr:MAG: hypothetical protein B7X00_00025 [Legionella sp. 21-45-4]